MEEEHPSTPPDEKQEASPKESASPPAEPSGAKADDDERSPEVKALNIRLKEEADKRRTVENKLQKLEEANEKARKDQLEEEGKISQLLEESKAENVKLKEASDAWKEYQTAKTEEILSELTDEQKEIAKEIPTLAGLEKYAKSLDITGLPVSNASPGRGGQGEFGGYSSRAEWAANDPDGFSKDKQTKRTGGVPSSLRTPDGTFKSVK